jgi:translation initiation factor IF-2
MRIHELAKKYNVSSDELTQLLQNAGYDVTNHMSAVEYDMLEALERHFNWSTPAKKKTKSKAKAKAKAKAKTKTKAKTKSKAKSKAKSVVEDEAPVTTKVKARLKTKARLQPRVKPEEEKAEKETGDKETKAQSKAEAKTKTKAKTKTATKIEKVEKPKDKTETAATKAKAEIKAKAKAKEAPKAEKPAEKAEKKEKATAAARTAAEKTPAAAPGKTDKPPKAAAVARPAKAEKRHEGPERRPEKKPSKDARPPKAEKKPRKGDKGPPRKQRIKKTPLELEAQRKAVRESVRRTLAKLETTRKTKRRKSKTAGDEQAELQPVQVQDKSTVALFADSLGLPVEDILQCCEEMGVAASAGQELDRDIIELVAEAIGRTVEIEAVYGEKRLREEAAIDPAKLKPRAPIVTVMGHVDHGKTSILDYIRKTNVASGEAGGITQHIGAYEVEIPSGKITFIDTPGHEAFTSMRARGAQLTDIVVLVVAADDGVMPQTIEAINHTKASGVPMVVAINKTDLAGANPANVKQQLTQYDVVVEEFGGDVVSAEVSARTGDGIDKLLEMILLQAELLELKADPTSLAQGVVVESKKEEGRGILCTVLVQQGTLNVSDVFVVGNECGKVRSLLDHRGKPAKEAKPAVPVQILGFNGVPEAGDSFIAVKNEREAREVSEKRQEASKSREMLPAKPLTLEDLYAQIQQGEVKELNIIVKGDTNGSVEALSDSLSPMVIEEVKVKIVHAGVGSVSEWDVLLANNTGALVIAFSTNVTPKAKSLAEIKGVEIRRYDVIYEAVEDIDDAMKGMLEPIISERVLGKAQVRKIFRVSKLGLIAGSMVTEGTITRNANARVYRGEDVVFEGRIASLKRFQEDVREVAENFECGIGLSGFDTLQESDVIEAFVVEEKARVF